MENGMQGRISTHKLPIGRMAGALVALGGLSGPIVAEASAGAATSVVVSTTRTPPWHHPGSRREDCLHVESEQDAVYNAVLADLARAHLPTRCDDGNGWEMA